MILRPDYGFDQSATALMMASDEINTNGYVLEWLPACRAPMEQGEDPSKFRHARCVAMNYVASAYAIQDRGQFKRIAHCLLQNLVMHVPGYQPTTGDMLMELALSITLGRTDLAKDCADQILSHNCARTSDELMARSEYDPWFPTAVAFARLYDRDYSGAQEAARMVAARCEGEGFTKMTCEVFAAISNAILGITLDQEPLLRDSLVELDRHRFEFLNGEITRYRQGKPSPLETAEFWDPIAGAILTMAQRVYEDLVGVRVPAQRFCDLDWIREAVK